MIDNGVGRGDGWVEGVPVGTEVREVREVSYVLISGAGEQMILVFNRVRVAEGAGALGAA